jgi:hypothetical protein
MMASFSLPDVVPAESTRRVVEYFWFKKKYIFK